MEINLMVLIAVDDNTQEENILFHTEDEIMELVQPQNPVPIDIYPYNLQEPIAVIWDDTWFLGFYLGKNNDGSLRVDHLVCDTSKTFKQHEAWKRELTHKS